MSVVLGSAGLSRWAAEAGAEEWPSSVVEAMGEPGAWGAATWWISLSRIQIRESASCGKIQAYPQLLVNNESGPLHYPERRSFHFTNGFLFCCSGYQWWSIAVVSDKSAFRLFITKRACWRIWWGELYLNSPFCSFWICIFNVWCVLSSIACPCKLKGMPVLCFIWNFI